MNWHSDPPNGWTAIYRVIVLLMLCFLAWGHVNAGNVPNPLDTLDQIVGDINPVGS